MDVTTSGGAEHAAAWAPTHVLDRVPPEALFVVSAISQYVGASIAVRRFHEVRPATVAWLRVAGAAIALLVVGARSLRRSTQWTRRQLAGAAVFGVATAAMNLFFYLGISRVDLGPATAIEFIGPITVAALRTRTKRNAAALVLATAGVVVLSGLELARHLGGQTKAVVFILLASAMWAVYIVIGSKVARQNQAAGGLAVGLAFGAVAIAPFGISGSGHVFRSPVLLFLCLVVGVFSNAIGYGIDQFVLRRMTVRRFALMLALLPVSALVMGTVLLHQRPSAAQLAGIALILIAVVTQDRS
jgi:inner membrane transporter RhtA